MSTAAAAHMSNMMALRLQTAVPSTYTVEGRLVKRTYPSMAWRLPLQFCTPTQHNHHCQHGNVKPG
jgi:hypothetical protein